MKPNQQKEHIENGRETSQNIPERGRDMSHECGEVLTTGITCTRPIGHGGTHWAKGLLASPSEPKPGPTIEEMSGSIDFGHTTACMAKDSDECTCEDKAAAPEPQKPLMRFRDWFKAKGYHADPIQVDWWGEKAELYAGGVASMPGEPQLEERIQILELARDKWHAAWQEATQARNKAQRELSALREGVTKPGEPADPLHEKK